MRPRIAAMLAVVMLLGCSSPVPPTTSPGSTTTASPAPTSSAAPTASPQLTATPVVTSTPSPGTTPTASPLATPRRSTTVKILEHLTALADIATQHQNNRASGTPGYDSSADYVADQLAALGYEVTRQTVDFTFFREAAPVSLTVGDETWTGIEWLHALLYAPSGDVEGRLQPVGIVNGTPTETSACDPNDWDEFTSGRIALVFGGVCRRRDVVELAQSFGAAALISMYPPWGANQTRQPTLFDPAGLDIPAIAVGREPSDALLAAVESGVDVRLSVEVEMTPATADNVIGEIDGNSDAVIMLGGHLDSVLDGPGINDNGSGVAALLSIAESVAAQPQPEKTVRFGFWAAEEPGTFGSGHYVDGLPAADREQIEAYINLDLVGSLHAVRHVYADTFAAPGSDEITRLLLDAFADAGTPALGVPSGGSDHIPFMEAGIPTGGLFSGIAPLTEADVPYAYFAEGYHVEIGTPADACYHLACDDLQNVDFGWAPGFVRAAAAALEALAY